MKATKEWLNSYVECNDKSLEELENIFTMTGTKVEEVISLYEMKNVVIGKVEKIEKHPDAEKLVICQVNVGKGEIIQIVTGASNLVEGDIVPVAKHGSILPNGIEIKKGMLRGIESNGMMCSYQELNLTKDFEGDQVEYGIMVLPKKYEENLGEEFLDVFSYINESVFDFEITPNRQDCQGVKGIARELAVGLDRKFNDNAKLKYSDLSKVDEIEKVTVKIDDEDCNKYLMAVVKDVKIEPSPSWMQRRLKAYGFNPINNIVDITNYVMLEIGQPMHAFDLNLLKEDENGKRKIVIRDSKENEKITLLDEKEYELQNDLVITDGVSPIALAGIMGGINSGINENTKQVVLESANFTRKRLRDTSRRINVSTDSYARFEKKLPLSLTEYALVRAIELIQELKAGTVTLEVIEKMNKEYTEKPQENVLVEIDTEKINNILGLEIQEEYIINLLEKLEFEIIEENNVKYAKAPAYRTDVSRIQDLAEEVIRFYGYDNLKLTLPKVTVKEKKENIKLETKQKAKNLLVNYGYNQIITYGFVNLEDLKKAELDKDIYGEDAIKVKNALGVDYEYMRTSLLPSMLHTISFNENKKNFNIKLFEISKIYQKASNILEGILPEEIEMLQMALTKQKESNKEKEKYSGMGYINDPIFEFKSDVLRLLTVLGLNGAEIENYTENNSFHKGKCAVIKKGRDIIGTFGAVNPRILSNFDIKQDVYVLELNLEKILVYLRKNLKAKEIGKFPEVTRDISMYVSKDVKYKDIESSITKANKKLIEEVKLFDIYENESNKERKSIAVRITFRDNNKTLEENEINTVMDKVIKNLENNVKAEIR
ncbi:MAG: phenylalanine--tRNA ligase subunit beta [Clostridiales bacterium]|nr:phenylalanine--tRNA ligase subunit beta [Clostridiales bacterium]